jgi:hypothetical protein
MAFDERHPGTETGRARGAHQARRAAADDDEVVEGAWGWTGPAVGPDVREQAFVVWIAGHAEMLQNPARGAANGSGPTPTPVALHVY